MSNFEENSDEFNHSHEDPFYVAALSDDAIKELSEYCKNIPEELWKTHRSEYYDHVNDKLIEDFRLCDIHCPEFDSIPASIGKSVLDVINKKYYQMDITLYEFQILRYGVGGNFQWHSDYGVSPNKSVWRKLTLSLQLSDPEDYDGGELTIIDYFNQHCQFPKAKGSSIVFDSRCPHKASPVTKGERLALVGWANGPKLK